MNTSLQADTAFPDKDDDWFAPRLPLVTAEDLEVSPCLDAGQESIITVLFSKLGRRQLFLCLRCMS